MEIPCAPFGSLSDLAVNNGLAKNRPLKVAFLLDSFEIGGTELNAVRTAEAFDPSRIELTVIHLQTRGPLRARYERLGIRMIHLPISNLYRPHTISQGFRLAKLLRQLRIDVVHSHDIYCNIFGIPFARVLTRCATVASRRWWYEAPRPGLVGLNRWASKFAHRVLANSEGVAHLLTGNESTSPERVVVVPNFVDESAFDEVTSDARATRRRAWGIPENAFAVGIVARLSPVKNHPMLLTAVSRSNERTHLVVIGDGPERVRLEELTHSLAISDRVHFIGEVHETQNIHWYFDASVLCSYSEGFPNSLIEAMAAARAVIATPVGGVPDAVKHNINGLLVPIGRVDQLAAVLDQLSLDPKARRSLGCAASNFARSHYSRSVVIEKLYAMYESLVRNRRPAGLK